MRDPVGAFERIRDNFILYLKTAFGTQFPSLEREREELLTHTKMFNREPMIEPLPQCEGSGKTIHDLTVEDIPELSQRELDDFKALAAAGLVSGFELYRHQIETLRKSLQGNNCVITAG